MSSTLDTILFGVLPYVALATLVVGTIWRYRYDRFGWTTRSSQLYESRLLRIASPTFHFGILMVAAGHVGGLIVPEAWTEAVGITEGMYHAAAITMGLIAGAAALVGISLLVYRRRTTGSVFLATTRNDKLMYVVLGLAILAGFLVTLLTNALGDTYNYRETISPWFRSLFILQPDVALMAEVPAGFKIHIVLGLLLFTIWPFTRLVHAFSAPVAYLFRPYVVYRTKDSAGVGARDPRRGWEPVGTQDRR